jgi:hypothetical protein
LSFCGAARSMGIFIGWLFLSACLPLVVPISTATAAEEDIDARWDTISRLRSEGDFESAVQILAGIIHDQSESDEILRHAYNQLVFTCIQMRDNAQVIETSREALDRFPDLEAQPPLPARINETYADLRLQMFGSLRITKPEGARILLNGDYVGTAPLSIDLLKIGDYTLSLYRSGYHNYIEEIQVGPSQHLVKSVSMDRRRDRTWWAYRIGAGVAAGTLVALSVTGGSKGTSPPEPLPGPPALP